ncbi:hypothetical protein ER308_17075 [Egibacter rhizosphaerae]|uniref:PpiC domain-containing protein n=1 Tax=Egibacter rhizosphaerae TaxID=1670831 RepID=A0A411YIQ9_9ACTN|nr:peptidylprolyl isomerase [Egibacter rhizosphaerae]QBI21113.1 hypothetical protein ER308_17075 [Egibacter rhizosphaerae]
MPRFLPARPTAVLVVLAFALAACAEVTGTGDPTMAAQVGERTIALDEVSETADEQGDQVAQTEADLDPQAARASEAQALTQLIVVELFEIGAGELGVEPTEEDLAEEREQLEAQFGGPEGLEQAGIEDEDLRLFALQEAVLEELVDDEELSEGLEDLRGARHILVESEEEAEDAIDRLDDEDFEDVAMDVSIDEGSAQQGGELGTIAPGELVPEFEDALHELEVGEVSDPVESEFGWHVIERLEDPDDELAEDQVRQEVGQQEFTAWIQGVAADTEIEVNPRFGAWNTEMLEVDPAGALDRPGPLEQRADDTDETPEAANDADDEGVSGS